MGKREIHTKYLDDLEKLWKRKDNAKVNLTRKRCGESLLIKLRQSKSPVYLLLSSRLQENGKFLDHLSNCELLDFLKRVSSVSITRVWQSCCKQNTEFLNGSVGGVYGYLCVTKNY